MGLIWAFVTEYSLITVTTNKRGIASTPVTANHYCKPNTGNYPILRKRQQFHNRFFGIFHKIKKQIGRSLDSYRARIPKDPKLVHSLWDRWEPNITINMWQDRQKDLNHQTPDDNKGLWTSLSWLDWMNTGSVFMVDATWPMGSTRQADCAIKTTHSVHWNQTSITATS